MTTLAAVALSGWVMALIFFVAFKGVSTELRATHDMAKRALAGWNEALALNRLLMVPPRGLITDTTHTEIRH